MTVHSHLSHGLTSESRHLDDSSRVSLYVTILERRTKPFSIAALTIKNRNETRRDKSIEPVVVVQG